MISFEEAIQIIRNVETPPLRAETVDLFEAAGRVLAQDIRTDRDMPPFDKSAMDGYACRRAELGNDLRIIEEIPAGKGPQKSLGSNECSRIMTGAKIPEGADCVIKKEDTENPAKDTVRFIGKETEDNICYKGEDLKKGETVLKKGILIKPRDIAVLATAGCAQPIVFIRPRVGILATGDELVEPDAKIDETQIRNSNSYQLFSQAKEAGALPGYFGIAGDAKEFLEAKINEARRQCDVLLLSGGVSMGDFDLVPEVLRETGFEVLFHKVRIKPGSPALFGVSKNGFCFGLPGNPVSSFVTFELFVKPFLYKMMGHEYKPLVMPMILAESIKLKRSERRRFLPVKQTPGGGVAPVPYHGSAHQNALCEADGIISIAEGATEIVKGEKVDVRQI